MVGAGWYSWFVLVVLTVIYAQQQWSRYSFNYLYNVSSDDDVTSIAAANNISYGNYGILTGYGFSATFCISGLFAGRAADVMSRHLIIFFGVTLWNAALFLMVRSDGFSYLLCWRLLLGLGQGFSNPASYSMIADYFPEDRRSQANGLFSCGVYIGGGLASLCISMANALGWRATCALIAAIGFALASIEGLFVREPVRTAAKEDDGPPTDKKKRTFSEALRTIFSCKLVVVIFIASSFRFMGGFVIGGYLPTLYSVVFPSYDEQYSYINAYVVATGGFMSSFFGGTLADTWRKAGEKRARMFVPAGGCFGALPFIAICCLAPHFYVSIILGLFFEYIIAECWFGPVVATMQSALPSDCRALAIATFTLIATFFGSTASFLVGALYESLLSNGHSPKVIRWIVLWSVVFSYAASGLLFLLGSRLVKSERDSTAAAAPPDEHRPLLFSSAGYSATTESQKPVINTDVHDRML